MPESGSADGAGTDRPRGANSSASLTIAIAFALIVLLYGCPQLKIPGMFTH